MILVTGASGLVGAAIARALLKQGETVRALRRPTSDLTWAQRYFEFHGDAALWTQLTWVEGDVLDVPSLESAISGCTRVFHAAAMVSFHPNDSAELLEINGTGTANVVNVCLAQQVTKLCYVSSTAALGRSKAGEAIDESRTWENSELNTPYAVSKYAAECEVWRGIEEGLNAVMVNPSIVLGPGRPDRSSATLLSRVASGFKFYPTGSNGFVPLEDVARACVHLEASDISAKRYLLCAKNWTYQQLFDAMAQALGVPAPHRPAQGWMLNTARILQWLLEKVGGPRAALTRIAFRNASNRVDYDGSAITETGFAYSNVPEAIQEAARFYRAHHG